MCAGICRVSATECGRSHWETHVTSDTRVAVCVPHAADGIGLLVDLQLGVLQLGSGLDRKADPAEARADADDAHLARLGDGVLDQRWRPTVVALPGSQPVSLECGSRLRDIVDGHVSGSVTMAPTSLVMCCYYTCPLPRTCDPDRTVWRTRCRHSETLRGTSRGDSPPAGRLAYSTGVTPPHTGGNGSAE